MKKSTLSKVVDMETKFLNSPNYIDRISSIAVKGSLKAEVIRQEGRKKIKNMKYMISAFENDSYIFNYQVQHSEVGRLAHWNSL